MISMKEAEFIAKVLSGSRAFGDKGPPDIAVEKEKINERYFNSELSFAQAQAEWLIQYLGENV